MQQEEKYFGMKSKCTGEIAQTVELAEKAEDVKKMLTILAEGNKKEFLETKKAQEIEISEQRNNQKYDFSDLGIGRY